MSQEQAEQIMAKAISDESFREALADDAATACAEYDVTAEEIEQIVASMEEQFSGELETRLSKRKMGGKFGSFSGPAGIDGLVD